MSGITSHKKGRTRPLALIVDDDPIMIQILNAVLKKLGIDTVSVSTAREFIAKLKTTQPDLCLVDLNIDVLGAGFSIIEAVRKVLGTEPVLIAVSGLADRAAIAHAMELGADDFIVKPLDRHVLVTKISRFIETSQILDEQLPLIPVPNSGGPAETDLELEIDSIDEFGVQVSGPHLLSKGAALRFSAAELFEATGRDQPILMTVTSTWVEADGRRFAASLEFDRSDTELEFSVRRWVMRKAPS